MEEAGPHRRHDWPIWRSARDRWGTVRFRYRLIASLTGYAVSGFTIWFVLFSHPGWAGRDVDVWLRVGAEVRAGMSPYTSGGWESASAFAYAPPWALVFGATSWVGKPILWALIAMVELLSLRFIAGSWLRVGYFGLCFLTGAEIASGAFNLLIAAALAAAARGDARAATFMALAKLSPALSVREWRGPALVLGLSLVATLPFLGWWADWARQLADAASSHPEIGYYQIPVSLRLAAALILLLVWRSPRAGVLAAAVAVPGLYAISIVLLYPLFTAPGVTRRIPGSEARVAGLPPLPASVNA